MLDQDFRPFAINTLKERETCIPRRPITPPAQDLKYAFTLSDPFGLRRAVVPVFRREPTGMLLGMGTAFQVDGWGSYLTADHVVDYVRDAWSDDAAPFEKPVEVDPILSPSVVILLSLGIVFGTVGIPEGAFAPIRRIDAVLDRNENVPFPWAKQGRYRPAADLASLSALFASDAPMRSSLPLRVANWQPAIGEFVLAIGFPIIKFDELDEIALRATLKEGMKAAYGRIVGVHPHGRGTDRSSPGFEVEADWPSGMSGGPVFNSAGEVVGVVSSSIPPSDDDPGIGYATCLGDLEFLSGLLPTLDLENPGWRRGLRVARESDDATVGFRADFNGAKELAHALGPGHRIHAASHRLGSDDYVCFEALEF